MKSVRFSKEKHLHLQPQGCFIVF